MEKVICVVGPTGVGKTALSVNLAKRWNTEVISGDSIQVYWGLDIGSAKVTEEERSGIVHHLLDIRMPTEGYSVKEFQDMARTVSRQLHAKNKVPILAGGTGLYVKSFLYDYHFDASSDADASLLAQYDDQTTDVLFERLSRLDGGSTATIHPNNRKRIIRALAIYDQSGIRKSEWIAQQSKTPMYAAYLIGLTCPRAILHERIDRRVELMFEEGLVQEVEGLLDAGITFEHQCMQGIGYQEFKSYFNKEIGLEEVKKNIKTHTRQFAKRQYTWFRNQMPVVWYDITVENWQDELNVALETWMQ